MKMRYMALIVQKLRQQKLLSSLTPLIFVAENAKD